MDGVTLATRWQAPPVPLAALSGVALAYWRGVAALRRRGRTWPRARSISFGAGLAVVVVALCSGLAHYDATVFAAHVVQHLLLAMVAPPLLAMGAPITLLVQAGNRSTQRHALAVLHHPVVSALTHPIFTWILFGGSLIALYATDLYPATLRHPLLHDVVHIHFLVSGALFFWPIVGVDPGRWRLPYGARLLYVAIALPFHAIVGLTLISTTAPLWPQHTLADQQVGGGVMMLAGDLLTLVIFSIVFMQWARADDREADRYDAQSGNVTSLPWSRSPSLP